MYLTTATEMGCGASQAQKSKSDVKDQQPRDSDKSLTDPNNSVLISALDQFREEALTAHNIRRKWHGAPPIELSDELNTIAQAYAEYLAKHGKFEHSSSEQRNGAGENLAAHSNRINGERVVEMYSEIKDYNFCKAQFSKATGHFTQVVWKDCSHIGVGMSSERGYRGMYIYVANYSPHGNVMGEFRENVLPKNKA